MQAALYIIIFYFYYYIILKFIALIYIKQGHISKYSIYLHGFYKNMHFLVLANCIVPGADSPGRLGDFQHPKYHLGLDGFSNF